jgi:hypothetical protein
MLQLKGHLQLTLHKFVLPILLLSMSLVFLPYALQGLLIVVGVVIEFR